MADHFEYERKILKQMILISKTRGFMDERFDQMINSLKTCL